MIAEDECWLYTYEELTGGECYQWCSIDEPPQKLHQEKSMLVFFFDYNGPLLIGFVPQGQKINSAYYCERLDDLDNSYLSRRRGQKHRGVFLLHDGATSHTSEETRSHLKNLSIKTLQHPPYSPDISPCDYGVFGELKKRLRGERFPTVQALQDKARHILKDVFKPPFYENVMFRLKERWQTICDNRGEYLTHSRLNAARYKHHTK